jgi:hypothetical protein
VAVGLLLLVGEEFSGHRRRSLRPPLTRPLKPSDQGNSSAGT